MQFSVKYKSVTDDASFRIYNIAGSNTVYLNELNDNFMALAYSCIQNTILPTALYTYIQI